MNTKKVIVGLFILIWLVVGIVAAIPRDTAHHVSYLGYKAMCPFTPYSTLISFAIAGVLCLLFIRLRS